MVVEWHGDNPYYLLCINSGLSPEDKSYQKIDLDEPGWATTYAEFMRPKSGDWHLVRKDDQGVALSMVVFEGEQPYYTSRVFGNTTSPTLIRAYGIGKKLHDDTVMRLWILENGQICGGDDVDTFGPRAISGR